MVGNMGGRCSRIQMTPTTPPLLFSTAWPPAPKQVGYSGTPALASKETAAWLMWSDLSDLWCWPQRVTRFPPSQSTTRRGPTFVCSENQKVQSLQHMHLFHRQSSVKHRHGRKVTCKRKAGHHLRNPVRALQPMTCACWEI